MADNVIAANLVRLRRHMRFSQGALAEKAGISRPSYRKIETGVSVPKADTLQALAKALDVKLQQLVAPVRTLSSVRFRALKKMTSREQILADVAVWLENFNQLEEIVDDKISYRFKPLARSLQKLRPGPDRARHAANKARQLLGLSDDELIRDICGLLESCGIKVFPYLLTSDSFFGLSIGESDGGPAIVVNVWDRISVERWIFSAAHELGHLLMHLEAYDVSQSQEDDGQEAEANLFASHFLMPDGVFQKEWQETKGLSFIRRVLKTKRIFRVSYKTVLARLVEKGVVTKDIWKQFNFEYSRSYGRSLQHHAEPDALDAAAFRRNMSESLRANEPEYLSADDFVEDRLNRLVRIAIETGDISLSRGAEILGIDLEAMRNLTASWVD